MSYLGLSALPHLPQILELHKQGISQREIGKRLNITYSSVRRLLLAINGGNP